jgi:hypothetical protein
MRGGQIGQGTVVEPDIHGTAVQRDDLSEHIAVGELDSLGRAGGAGGVDDGDQVAGFDGPPRGVEIEIRVGRGFQVRQGGGAFRGPVDEYDVVERDSRGADGAEELLFGHDDLVLGIGEGMRDLLRRAGVVDGERGGADVQGGGVDEVEFRAVGKHHAEGVATAEAECGQSGGDHPDPVAVFAPGDLLRAADGAQRDRVGSQGDGLLEGRRHGVDEDARAVPVDDLCGHGPIPVLDAADRVPPVPSSRSLRQ